MLIVNAAASRVALATAHSVSDLENPGGHWSHVCSGPPSIDIEIVSPSFGATTVPVTTYSASANARGLATATTVIATAMATGFIAALHNRRSTGSTARVGRRGRVAMEPCRGTRVSTAA